MRDKREPLKPRIKLILCDLYNIFTNLLEYAIIRPENNNLIHSKRFIMKKLKLPVVKWIWDIYKPFHKHLLALFLFIVGLEALALLSPVIYGEIINSLFVHRSIEITLSLIGLSFLLYGVSSIVDYIRDKYSLAYFDFKIQQHVANLVLNKNLSFSMGQHLSTHSGVKQSIINRGQASLMSLAFMISFDIIPSILRILFITGAIVYTSFIIGGIVLVGMILFLYITFRINVIMRPKTKNLQTLWHQNGKLQHEFITNISLIQSNSQEQKVLDEFDRNNSGVGKFGKILWGAYTDFALLRSFISIFTRTIIMIIGVIYVYNGYYLPGYLVILLTWSSDVFNVLNRFSRMHRQIIDMYAAVQKLHTLYIIEPEVKIIDNPVFPEKFFDSIEFKNVSFSYPQRSSELFEDEKKKKQKNNDLIKETLRDVSFSINSGQTVAFVGPSGAGKTTIANLLLRAFDPTGGQIIIDGNDLRTLDLHYYRTHIGYVEQNVTLFDNTMRYNILFGLNNGKAKYVTEEHLDEIARMSCVNKFYDKLEKGFDTLIGERGIWLSGGERQRVGIARAFAKNPAIMIFDEATSNLDSQNESLIKESIAKTSIGRTTIIITHRLSTVQNADKIVVFDKGHVVGQGTHKELLMSCQQYGDLVKKQVSIF